jgi:hypothetical protein
MVDLLIPNWIKEVKSELDERERQRNVRLLESALLQKTIMVDGPKFWRDLLKELLVTVDALSNLALCGALTEIPGDPPHYEVAVASGGRRTFTNVFFGDGQDAPVTRIRCHPSDASAFDLKFALHRDSVFGSIELRAIGRDLRLISAERAAQEIVEPMAKRVPSR